MDSSRLGLGASPSAAWLPRAVIAGFVASVVMHLVFAVAYGAALLIASAPLADRPYAATLRQWFHALTDNALIDLARPNLYLAIAVYFAGGLIWAILYAYVFEPRMSGPDWRRGLLFALVPWVFSLVVFLPLVGGGFLGLALGAGPFPIIGNFILHLAYGATLGELYGEVGELLVDSDLGRPAGDDLWAMPTSEVGAAKGLVAGLALGGVLALAVSAIPQLSGGDAPSLLNPFVAMVAAPLVFGAFGLFIGSLVGISAPRQVP